MGKKNILLIRFVAVRFICNQISPKIFMNFHSWGKSTQIIHCLQSIKLMIIYVSPFPRQILVPQVPLKDIRIFKSQNFVQLLQQLIYPVCNAHPNNIKIGMGYLIVRKINFDYSLFGVQACNCTITCRKYNTF